MTMLQWDALFFFLGVLTGGAWMFLIMRRRELRRGP